MTIDAFTEDAQSNHSDRPDPVLTPLSNGQATLLVQLSLTTAARLGLAVAYDGSAALVPADRSASGPVLGLSNLARILGRYDVRHWPTLVEEHLTELLQQFRDGPPAPPSDPERELIQRLVPRDALPTDWTADRPDFLPGLVSVPATVEDGIVTMYLEPADLGLTWSEAERFGLSNLRSLTDDVSYVGSDELRVALITGTAFAASRALVLDTVLRESLQVDQAPHGVLAALPARDLLLVHVIQDLSLIPALGLLLNLSARSHAQDPGPLNPDVFLVTPTPGRTTIDSMTWHPATSSSIGGTPLRLSPELESLTELLSAREPPAVPRGQMPSATN